MTGIRKEFPGVVALDRRRLSTVRAGEVHVLLGENGAGKSTLMKILSGAQSKDAGTVSINGSETEINSPRHARELGIGIIYQELTLVPELSPAQNIFLGREPRIFGWIIDDRQMKENAALALEQVDAQGSGRRTGTRAESRAAANGRDSESALVVAIDTCNG
jgi:ribose transport system ATP-binding protein